jgi:ketosteroid isomerase-like protein
MSQENVEIVRRLVPVKERRPDEYEPYLHPEVEIIPAPNFPDSEVFHGHAGFERWKTRWPSTFERHDIEPTRFWDAGNQVVVELHERALWAGGSIPVERHFAHIWTFREGAVISIQIFNDPAEALEATGLSE